MMGSKKKHKKKSGETKDRPAESSTDSSSSDSSSSSSSSSSTSTDSSIESGRDVMDRKHEAVDMMDEDPIIDDQAYELHQKRTAINARSGSRETDPDPFRCSNGWRYKFLGQDEPYSAHYPSEKIVDKTNYIKKKHRPVLKMRSWQRYNFADSFPLHKDEDVRFLEEVDRKHQVLQAQALRDGLPTPRTDEMVGGIDRIHYDDYSKERFGREYERPRIPVVIQGACDDWPSGVRWSIDALDASKYRSCPLKAGEDDDGYSVRLKLKYFLQYCKTNRDDSPLYIFDDSFDERKIVKEFIHDYKIPSYFNDDLFKLIDEDRRPPYRWFLIGPERSGTTLHIDPLSTSAWNALLRGRKRWILYPPTTRKSLGKGLGLKQAGEDGEAITWFERVLPRIKEREFKLNGGDNSLGMVEFIQYPGEVVYIPGGWWHAVLNLDDTVACTQNFVSCNNFLAVWRKTRKGRKHMARRWLAALEKQYPDLAEAAKELDEADGYDLWASSGKKKKKKKKKKSKSSKKKRTSNK